MKLSVITICLRDPKGLKATLLSCFEIQRRLGSDFEHIVVDSSPEAHAEVKADSAFGYVRWVETPPKGIYSAINVGTKAAAGEIVWHLNAGDICSHTALFLEAYQALIASGDVDLLYAPVYFTRDGTVVQRASMSPHFKMNLLGHVGIFHQGTLMRKKIFDQLGLFREDLKIAGDFEFWVRVANANLPTQYFAKAFVNFDLSGLSNQNIDLVIRENQIVYKTLHRNIFESCYSRIYFESNRLRNAVLLPFLKRFKFYQTLRNVYRKTLAVREP